MKPEGTGQSRHFTLAIAVFCVLIAGLATPVFLSGKNSDLAIRAAAVFAAARDTFALSAPIRISQSPSVVLQGGSLSLGRKAAHNETEKDPVPHLLESGSAKLMLEDATFVVDSIGQTELPEQQPENLVAPLLNAFTSLSFESLHIRRAAVLLRKANGAAAVLSNVSAEILRKGTGTVTARGSFSLHGDDLMFDVKLDTSAQPASGNKHSLTLKLSGKFLDAKASGWISTGGGVQFRTSNADLKIRDARATARWLGLAWPDGPGMRDFHANGEFEWSNGILAFQKAVMRMDGNEATGTISLNVASNVPSIDGTLALEILDLQPYLAAPSNSARPSVLDFSRLMAAAGFAEFYHPLVKQFEADLRVSAGRMTTGQQDFGRSAASLSLKGGKLMADVAEIDLDSEAEGSGQISADMTVNPPKYTVSGKLSAADLGRAASDVFGVKAVKGRGDITVDLTAIGTTWQQVLDSLDGKIMVGLSGGGLAGIDFAKLASRAPPDDGTVWTQAIRGTTRIDHLDAHLFVADGVLTAHSLRARAGEIGINAVGTIGITEKTLDVRLSMFPLLPAETASIERAHAAPGDADGRSEGELAAQQSKPLGGDDRTQRMPASMVVQLRGPWAQPAVQLVPRSETRSYPSDPAEARPPGKG